MPAGGYAERTARLFRVAGLLKRYADQYKLAVVVTNQVALSGPADACAAALMPVPAVYIVHQQGI